MENKEERQILMPKYQIDEEEEKRLKAKNVKKNLS